MRKSSRDNLQHERNFYNPNDPDTILNEKNKLKAFNFNKITNLSKLANANVKKVINNYESKKFDNLETIDELMLATDVCFMEFDNLFRDILNHIVLIKTFLYERQAQKYSWVTYDNELRYLRLKYNQSNREDLLDEQWSYLLNNYYKKLKLKIKRKNVIIDSRIEENMQISLTNLTVIEKIVHQMNKKIGNEAVELHPGLAYYGHRITPYFSKKEEWVDEIFIEGDEVTYTKVKLSDMLKKHAEHELKTKSFKTPVVVDNDSDD